MDPASIASANAEKAKEFLERQLQEMQERAVARENRRQWMEDYLAEQNLSRREKDTIRRQWARIESENMRRARARLTLSDFERIKVIGRGAFGEVLLVRDPSDGHVYAMKCLHKAEMRRRGQVTHVRTERDVMAASSNGSACPFLVQLHCAFQDSENLYLVMEYYPGGDMMTLLMRRDILPETWVVFYAAEIVLAVAALHHLSYIHRDLKPDNILFDQLGHAHLSDFGLAAAGKLDDFADRTGGAADRARRLGIDHGDSERDQIIQTWKRNRRLLAHSTVGTPDYIAPEVLLRTDEGYGPEADWWSVGAIIYESLFGFPPFCAATPQETCQRIVRWRETLTFPSRPAVSANAIDLLRRLLCDAPQRLGRNGVAEIQKHSFFKNIDWAKMMALEVDPPYIPEVASETDTANFDEFSDHDDLPVSPAPPKSMDVDFAGYTFKRGCDLGELARQAGLELGSDAEAELDSRGRQFTEGTRRARPTITDVFDSNF